MKDTLWDGGGTRAREGGSRGFGSGGVGGRGTGPRDGANFATCIVFLMLLTRTKGGGVTHRSWPGGQGGKPRALVAGLDGSSRRLGPNTKKEVSRPTLGPRLGLGGGPRDFGAGGVEGTATCVVFLTFLTRTKRRKNYVF